jgi:hypothetical protein
MIRILPVAKTKMGSKYSLRTVKLVSAVCATGLLFLATSLTQSAAALSPPAVTTLPATPVGATTATLQATVNPEGLRTEYYFEWGVTKSDQHYAKGGTVEGTSAIPVSSEITGLGENKTFHYHIVAVNSAGKSYGADVMVATSTPKLAPAKGSGAFPVALTSSGGKAVMTGMVDVECQHESASGEFTGANTLKLTIKFSECINTGTGKKCTTTTTGVIETKELTGALTYADRGASGNEQRTAGVLLTPGSGEPISEFTCGAAVKALLGGSVVGLVTPINTRGKTINIAFRRSASGAQEPSAYEAEGIGRKPASLTLGMNGGEQKPETLEETTSATTFTGEEGTVEAAAAAPFAWLVSGNFPHFTASGGKTVLEGILKVECQHESVTGEFVGVGVVSKELRETDTFSECINTATGKSCGSAKSGTIETTELTGLVEYTYPAKTSGEGRQAGVVLSAPGGGTISEFTCGGAVKGTLGGSVIGVITPLNTPTESATIAIKRSAGGAQEPSEYEAESGAAQPAGLKLGLNGGEEKAATLEMPTQTLTFAPEGLFEYKPVIFIEA